MEHQRNRTPTRRGLTLVESVAAIGIVGIMLVAALNTLAGSVKARHIRADSGQRQLLAHDLMAEILTCFYEESVTKADQDFTAFDENTVSSVQPDTGRTPVFGAETSEADGTRIHFDDVDDYHGWTSTPPKTKDGQDLVGYEGWTRTVTVAFVQISDGRTLSGSDTGLKRVTVTVTDPDGRSKVLGALRSQVSAFDQPPNITTNYINWVGLELHQTGSDKTIYSGALSVNQAP